MCTLLACTSFFHFQLCLHMCSLWPALHLLCIFFASSLHLLCIFDAQHSKKKAKRSKTICCNHYNLWVLLAHDHRRWSKEGHSRYTRLHRFHKHQRWLVHKRCTCKERKRCNPGDTCACTLCFPKVFLLSLKLLLCTTLIKLSLIKVVQSNNFKESSFCIFDAQSVFLLRSTIFDAQTFATLFTTLGNRCIIEDLKGTRCTAKLGD